MSKVDTILEKARANQVRARYYKHYEEQANFIIEALTPNLVQIIVKPNEAVDLLGDLMKYVIGKCRQVEEDY